MLEALVSNKLQRCIYLALGLYPGEPKRRLMLAAEEVIEARRGKRMHGGAKYEGMLRHNWT